jgi:hypothetical protein
MKTLTLFSFLLVTSSNLHADAFILKITYTEGEKSKDSRSSTTIISMTGNEISYSKTFSGRKVAENQSKSCVFTDSQTTSIQDFITQNKLNVTDSLFQKHSKYKSFELFVNLTINLVMWENISEIHINGDTKEFDGVRLYENSLELIRIIERYLC